MTECIWPYGCLAPTTRRDDGTWACEAHLHVHVASTGSWLDGEAS